MSKQSEQSATRQSVKSGKKKTSTNVTKSSKKPSKKPTYSGKAPKTTSMPKTSIYQLDSWKWNYEDVTKPKNRVVVSLKKRIKHAWEVLLG